MPGKKRKRWLRISLYSLVILSAFIVLLAVLQWQNNLLTDMAVDYLNKTMNGRGELRYERITGSLFFSIEIDDVQFRTPAGLTAEAGHVKAGYSPFSFIFGQPQVNRLYVDRLRIRIPPADSTSAKPVASVPLDSVLTWLTHTNLAETILNNLPLFRLRRLDIVLGEVTLVNRGQTWNNIYLQLNDLRASHEEFRVSLKKLSGHWQEKNINIRRLSFDLKCTRERIELNNLEAASDRSRINISALYDFSGRTPQVNVEIFELRSDLNEWALLTQSAELEKGFFKANGRLDGVPDHFALTLQAHGRTRRYALDTLFLDMEYNKGLFNLRDLQLAGNAGMLQAALVVERDQRAEGTLTFRNLDIQKVVQYPVATKMNGLVAFHLKNLDLKRMSGHGRLMLYQTTIDSVLLDTLLLNLSAGNGAYTIKENSFLRLAQHSRFMVDGSINRDRQLDVLLSTFDNNLQEAAARFGLDSLSGIFDGHVRATGSLKNPDISANLQIPHIAYKNMMMDSVGFTLYMQQIFTGRKGEGHFLIQNGRIGDFPLSRAGIDTRFDSTMLVVDNLSFRSEDNYIRSSVNVQFEEDKTVIGIAPFEAKYQDYWLKNQDTLIFTVDSGGINIENFILEGPQNSEMEVSGFWSNDIRDMQLALSLDGVQIEPFRQFMGDRFSILGRIDGVAEVLTPLSNPNLDIDIVADSLVLNGVELGTVTSVFQYANKTFYINRLDLRYDDTYVNAQGDMAFSFDKEHGVTFSALQHSLLNFSLDWQNLYPEHFQPLFSGERKFSGAISGYLEAGGHLNHPRVRAGLKTDHFVFEDYQLDTLRIFSQYNDGFFIIDSLSTQLNGTTLNMKGWLRYNLNLSDIDTNIVDKPFQFWIASADSQMKFLSRFGDQLENIKGPYQTELHLGGTLGRPSLIDGFFRLDNGQIILSKIKDPIRNVQIRAVVRDSVLELDQAEAYSVADKDFWEKGWSYVRDILPWASDDETQGRVSVRGGIALEDVLHPKYDLDVRLNNFYIDYFVENTELLINSDNLSIRGRDTIHVSGEVYIPRGTYQVDVEQIQRDMRIEAVKTLPRPPYVSMNLSVLLPGNFAIVSSPTDFLNNFRILIEGELHILKEPLYPENRISGFLNTQSGYYQAWNQKFTIQDGTIRFIDPTRFNPQINLILNKRIGDQLFELNIYGPMDKLQQQITVYENGREVPMSEADKLTLLTFGLNTKELQQNTQSSLRDVGVDVLANSVLNVLERQAEQATGLDKIKIDSQQSLFDIRKGRLNSGLQDASISFGKYLTSDLYIEYRTRFNSDIPAPKLSWDAGNRIQLEYRVNRNWRLNSFYEKTIEGNNKFQIGVDWEYTF